ncbi:MAG: hypothetical protein JRN20_01880 [Nitrososphaerota archaeon]|nr:hypothetical protein [Nitrososphaerota archaeon]MDG6923760.1 hypothetical protein [Nitrososphaerota archaeon]
MKSGKGSVPLQIPADIWQPLAEIRTQLDAQVSGVPTPIEEALREVILHYRHCPHVEKDIEAFRIRSKSWKRSAVTKQ